MSDWKTYEEPGKILVNSKLKDIFEPGSASVNTEKDFHILEFIYIKKWLDDKVAEWHEGDSVLELHEHLKMTKEEYSRWFKDHHDIPQDFLERIEE